MNHNKLYFIPVYILFCCMCYDLNAQKEKIPVLEREITVHQTNSSIEAVLSDISGRGGFVFSYDPAELNATNIVSLNIDKKPVRLAINTLFKGNVEYKVKGNYVILKKRSTESTGKKKIEGYVYDSKSGDKLADVSVIDKSQLITAVTDKYGYFSMNVPEADSTVTLQVSREGYGDSLMPVTADPKPIEVTLHSKDNKVSPDSIVNKVKDFTTSFFSKIIIPDQIITHTRNFTQSFSKHSQISVLPFVSTNGFLTGAMDNDISVNVIAGYTRNVKKFECGAVMNIVRDNAQYCQLAGVANIVGDTVSGMQGAGVFNYASVSRGMQAARVMNVVTHTADYQCAGVMNQARQVTGMQLSGCINNAQKFYGLQGTGVINITQESDGAQLAGVYNQAYSFSGVQAAGVMNLSQEYKGVQVAGVMNKAAQMNGMQIAGVVNHARYIKGVQLAVINIADSCDGIPIGLFNFVKRGYHKLELSADETFYANMAFRSGVQRLHMIFMAGMQPDDFSMPLWYYGYGAGTSFNVFKRSVVDVDVTIQDIHTGDKFSFTNSLYKIYCGIDRPLSKKISIAAGITCNMFVADTKDPLYAGTYSKLPLYSIADTQHEQGYNMKLWVGGKLALRMF